MLRYLTVVHTPLFHFLNLFSRVQGFLRNWSTFGTKWLVVVLWTPLRWCDFLILTLPIYHSPLNVIINREVWAAKEPKIYILWDLCASFWGQWHPNISRNKLNHWFLKFLKMWTTLSWQYLSYRERLFRHLDGAVIVSSKETATSCYIIGFIC